MGLDQQYGVVALSRTTGHRGRNGRDDTPCGHTNAGLSNATRLKLVAVWKSDTFKWSCLAEPLKFFDRGGDHNRTASFPLRAQMLVCGPHLIPPVPSSNLPAPALHF